MYCLCPIDDSRSTEVESTRLHAFKWPFIIQGRFHLASWALEKEQTLSFAFSLLALLAVQDSSIGDIVTHSLIN